MTIQHTARIVAPYPELSDSADVPRDLEALALLLDPIVAIDSQGLFSARPVSTPSTPGTRGRYYWATDTDELWRDNGTGWDLVNVQLTEVVDGPADEGTLRTLGTGPLQACGGTDPRLSDERVPLDNTVTAAKVHTTLKPSTGAGSSTEALRALGTAAGRAAAGTHGTQHDPQGDDPLSWLLQHRIGTLSGRPAAAAWNAGITYFATDVNGGTLYESNGSAWLKLARGATEGLSGYLDYVELGTGGGVTVTGTSVGAATTIITGAAISFDGATGVQLEFSAPHVQIGSDTATDEEQTVHIHLFDNGSQVAEIARYSLVRHIGAGHEVFMGIPMLIKSARRTPSAGSHTFSVRAWKEDASTVQFFAGPGGASQYAPLTLSAYRI